MYYICIDSFRIFSATTNNKLRRSYSGILGSCALGCHLERIWWPLGIVAAWPPVLQATVLLHSNPCLVAFFQMHLARFYFSIIVGSSRLSAGDIPTASAVKSQVLLLLEVPLNSARFIICFPCKLATWRLSSPFSDKQKISHQAGDALCTNYPLVD